MIQRTYLIHIKRGNYVFVERYIDDSCLWLVLSFLIEIHDFKSHI